VVQLICEGKCNPNIHAVDVLAQEYHAAVMGSKRYDRKELMVSLQRTLVHTDHEYSGGDYRCLECLSRRRWGKQF
jgi:hypothetical protein